MKNRSTSDRTITPIASPSGLQLVRWQSATFTTRMPEIESNRRDRPRDWGNRIRRGFLLPTALPLSFLKLRRGQRRLAIRRAAQVSGLTIVVDRQAGSLDRMALGIDCRPGE